MCVYYARCTQLASHKLCIGSVMNMLNRDLGTGDLCDNIGLVGVYARWSYVTASPSHHDQAIPILSPLLFMHVGHPYIPLFKIREFLIYLLIGRAGASPPSRTTGTICRVARYRIVPWPRRVIRFSRPTSTLTLLTSDFHSTMPWISTLASTFIIAPP